LNRRFVAVERAAARARLEALQIPAFNAIRTRDRTPSRRPSSETGAAGWIEPSSRPKTLGGCGSPRTFRRAMQKLEADNRTQAVAIALRETFIN
jgi:hypothetical protein